MKWTRWLHPIREIRRRRREASEVRVGLALLCAVNRQRMGEEVYERPEGLTDKEWAEVTRAIDAAWDRTKATNAIRIQ